MHWSQRFQSSSLSALPNAPRHRFPPSRSLHWLLINCAEKAYFPQEAQTATGFLSLMASEQGDGQIFQQESIGRDDKHCLAPKT
jgi:hypothetical protein